jgi:excisionase family DNA binding protein
MPQSPITDTASLLFEGRLGVSIEEAARALDQHTDTIYRMIGDGRLVASKMGRRTIVHVDSLLRLLADTVVAPRPRVRRHQPWQAKPPRALQPGERPHHRRGKAVQVLQSATP